MLHAPSTVVSARLTVKQVSTLPWHCCYCCCVFEILDDTQPCSGGSKHIHYCTMLRRMRDERYHLVKHPCVSYLIDCRISYQQIQHMTIQAAEQSIGGVWQLLRTSFVMMQTRVSNGRESTQSRRNQTDKDDSCQNQRQESSAILLVLAVPREEGGGISSEDEISGGSEGARGERSRRRRLFVSAGEGVMGGGRNNMSWQ